MRKKLLIDLPKRKEAKNVSYKVIDGKLEVSYDLEDKFEPKDGDFLCAENYVFIYNGIQSKDSFGAYIGVLKNGEIDIPISKDSWAKKEVCRYATQEEKEAFLARLENSGKVKWNIKKKRLEDIYVPKFGDIVKVTFNDINCFKRNYMICIYPDKPNIPDDDFFDIAFIDMMGNYTDSEKGSNRDAIITRASIEAEKELFDKLAEAGKKWNPDTKQLENIRWKPKDDEIYYYVESWGDVGCSRKQPIIDELRIVMNNCYKTEDAARKVADQIKEIFKNSKAE